VEDLGPILFWSFLLLVLIGLMFFSVVWIKKWLATDDDAVGGFTLGDLRRMKASGEMSDEEYERAKVQIMGAVKMAAEKMGVKSEMEGKRLSDIGRERGVAKGNAGGGLPETQGGGESSEQNEPDEPLGDGPSGVGQG
jgi:hypothetical protein